MPRRPSATAPFRPPAHTGPGLHCRHGHPPPRGVDAAAAERRGRAPGPAATNAAPRVESTRWPAIVWAEGFVPHAAHPAGSRPNGRPTRLRPRPAAAPGSNRGFQARLRPVAGPQRRHENHRGVDHLQRAAPWVTAGPYQHRPRASARRTRRCHCRRTSEWSSPMPPASGACSWTLQPNTTIQSTPPTPTSAGSTRGRGSLFPAGTKDRWNVRREPLPQQAAEATKGALANVIGTQVALTRKQDAGRDGARGQLGTRCRRLPQRPRRPYNGAVGKHHTSFQGSITDAISDAIRGAISDARIEVVGGDGHYRISVVSSQFAGKTMIESHRLVYSAIAPLMTGNDAPVHAVDSLTTQTP